MFVWKQKTQHVEPKFASSMHVPPLGTSILVDSQQSLTLDHQALKGDARRFMILLLEQSLKEVTRLHMLIDEQSEEVDNDGVGRL
jgi:hypothetical protein